MVEKAQREAAKKAHLDRKVAAIRAEKQKLQRRIEPQAQADADRIAKARARAGAALLGLAGTFVDADLSLGTPDTVQGAPEEAETSGAGICSKCGDTHVDFREWLRCNKPAVSANTS